jgi:hypothetical protein
VAVGKVSNLEQEMIEASAAAHAEAVAAVQAAPVKFIDETGSKERGQKRWLQAHRYGRVAPTLVQA